MNYKTHELPHGRALGMMGALVLLILSIILYLTFDNFNVSFVFGISFAFFWAAGSYTFVLISLYRSIKRFDAFIIFVILGIPFALGRHIVFILDMISDGKEAFRGIIQNCTYYKTTYYYIASLMSLCIGYFLVKKQFRCNANEFRNSRKKPNSNMQKNMYRVSLVFALASFGPYIINSIADIRLTLTYGYGYRIIEGANRTTTSIIIISAFFLPAVIAMLISRKRKEVLSIIFALLYFTLYTISGSRINSFCYLALFIYLYLFWWKKGSFVNTKKYIRKIVLLTFIVAFAFSVVSSYRGAEHGRSVMENIADIIGNIWKNNPISAIFYETGNTFIATSGIIEHCPSDIAHIWGVSYISSFIYILPNAITRNFLSHFVFTDEAISPFLVSYGGVGSSYSAEAYYNFGFLGGLIALLIIGMIWGKLSKELENSILNGDQIRLYIFSQVFIAIVFMVRSDLVYRFRFLAWNVMPIVFITVIINNISNKKMSRYGRKE